MSIVQVFDRKEPVPPLIVSDTLTAGNRNITAFEGNPLITIPNQPTSQRKLTSVTLIEYNKQGEIVQSITDTNVLRRPGPVTNNQVILLQTEKPLQLGNTVTISALWDGNEVVGPREGALVTAPTVRASFPPVSNPPPESNPESQIPATVPSSTPSTSSLGAGWIVLITIASLVLMIIIVLVIYLSVRYAQSKGSSSYDTSIDSASSTSLVPKL
jgi:hypothetical protein